MAKGRMCREMASSTYLKRDMANKWTKEVGFVLI
jgi:hypothetical protein